MSLVDVVLPGGSKYVGVKVPEGCTVKQWKSLLEGGTVCDKVLYAKRLVCHLGDENQLLEDNDKVPTQPGLVSVNGPSNVLQMLDLALRKWLGPAVPPPIDAAEGRAYACASRSCRLMVNSDFSKGGYCCARCQQKRGREHSPSCEGVPAPRHAPKASAEAVPLQLAPAAPAAGGAPGRRRLLVLRHGSRPDGPADPLLDGVGERQVATVAQYFKHHVKSQPGFLPITAVFCSPFARALQTAGPVARVLGVPLKVEWGFSELLAHGWLQEADPLPALRARPRERLDKLAGPDTIDYEYRSAVEPEYPDVVGRLSPGDVRGRQKATQRHKEAVKAALAATGGSVLVVGHGSTHDFVASALCPAAWEHFTSRHTPYCVPNCGISELVEDVECVWRVTSFGGRPWAPNEEERRTPPEKVPVVTGALPEELRKFLLAAVPVDMTAAVNEYGFERCVDHPKLPSHHYIEGYFHALQGRDHSCVHSAHPREPFRDRLQRRPAPPQVGAFCEAFRRRNLRWLQEIAALVGEAFPPVLAAFERGGHFADISVQFNWGTAVRPEHAAWHTDAPYSLLHLALGLRGERTLLAQRRLRPAPGGTGQEASPGVEALHQAQGAVYLSSPACFEHAVEYPEAAEGQSVVSMQCRFLLAPEEILAMTQMFRSCSTTLYEVMARLERYTLRLPTLEQVKSVMAELAAGQLARPLLERELDRDASRTMRQKDLRSYDEDWAKPGSSMQCKLVDAVKKSRPSLNWPYIDGKDRDEIVSLLAPSAPDHSWSVDYNPHFAAELLYQGVLLKSAEVPRYGLKDPIQVLVLCCPKQRSILDLQRTHISRQVRRRAGRYVVSLDTAFDEVLLGCVRAHGEAWLFRGCRWLLRSMAGRNWPCSGPGRGVGLHSCELWDADGQLAAGEVGCTVGGVYRSLAGFRRRHAQGAGEVQLVLLAALLHKMGFVWMDLGEDEPYKTALGSRTVDQAEYLQRLRRDRDKQTSFRHPRIEGSELLYHLQSALLDCPGS